MSQRIALEWLKFQVPRNETEQKMSISHETTLLHSDGKTAVLVAAPPCHLLKITFFFFFLQISAFKISFHGSSYVLPITCEGERHVHPFSRTLQIGGDSVCESYPSDFENIMSRNHGALTFGLAEPNSWQILHRHALNEQMNECGPCLMLFMPIVLFGYHSKSTEMVIPIVQRKS